MAGTAAAISGSLQQLCGAFGGYLVGLVDHQGVLQLSTLMLLMALIALLGHAMLARTSVGRY